MASSSASSSSSSLVEKFEKTLSETVLGEKLSGSRVEKVRTQALREFHHAEQLASVIERVHRQSSSKTSISSLYLFDAMSRYAQDVVRKRASGFEYKEAKPPPGSKAKAGTKDALVDAANAFLAACSRIVEEIVVSTGLGVRSDQRDKVTKVVDIWIKANTFDVELLERIRSKVLQGDEGGAKDRNRRKDKTAAEETGNSLPSPYGMAIRDDETESNRDNATMASTVTKEPNVPSSILAMLGGDASAKTDAAKAGQPTTQAMPSLDPNQLAMLQRVAAQQQQQQQQQGEQNRDDVRSYYDDRQHGREQRYADPSQNQPVHDDLQPRSSYIPTSSSLSSREHVKEAAQEPGQPHFRADVSVGDLSHFDMSTFDPTQPSEWLKLAQHWHNTYQYIPSNQELMTGLLSVMQSQMYMQAQMMQTGTAFDTHGASYDPNTNGGGGGGSGSSYW